MKKVLLSLIVITACISAKSQLANHKWQGTLQIDNQPTNVTLDFKKDTVNALFTDSGELLENMLYTAKSGVVTFQKVSGRSECGSDIIGKYKFVLKNDSILYGLLKIFAGTGPVCWTSPFGKNQRNNPF